MRDFVVGRRVHAVVSQPAAQRDHHQQHRRSEARSLAPTTHGPHHPSQVARTPTANTTGSPPTDRSSYEDELLDILLAPPSPAHRSPPTAPSPPDLDPTPLQP